MSPKLASLIRLVVIVAAIWSSVAPRFGLSWNQEASYWSVHAREQANSPPCPSSDSFNASSSFLTSLSFSPSLVHAWQEEDLIHNPFLTLLCTRYLNNLTRKFSLWYFVHWLTLHLSASSVQCSEFSLWLIRIQMLVILPPPLHNANWIINVVMLD
jgi:hypothetical protein